MTLALILHAMFSTVYTLSLAVVCLFGYHRWLLLMLYWRHRGRPETNPPALAAMPVVTVQLPICNEKQVVERVINHACRLDWPRERLQIQVLDDSSDGQTSVIAAGLVNHWRERGVDIEYLARGERVGYKAGNLAHGLRSARGEFVMIFDADFVPEPDVLQRCMPYFADPAVAAVQTRWDHLNRDASLLTRGQAMLLDGHFSIVQFARNRSGRFFSFNGTGGVWRVSAIRSAGGWQYDTITEDMDLSYRAQLKGWKLIFRPELSCPGELPPDINAFKSQQQRWTKGGVQTAIKLLPRVWLSDQPLRVKLEATMHLTSFAVHLFIVVLVLLLYPAMVFRAAEGGDATVWRTMLDLGVFALASLSAGVFYLCGQAALGRSWLRSLPFLPFLMALGVGISISNAKAALEAVMGRTSGFVCTPKLGDAPNAQALRQVRRNASPWVTLLELAMGAYLGLCAYRAFANPACAIGGGFLLQFSLGFFYVALGGLTGLRWPLRPRKVPLPA